MCRVAVLLTAVKFGRMSRQQREKVVGEAKFHRQNSGGGGGGAGGGTDPELSTSPTNNNQYRSVCDRQERFLSVLNWI